MKWLKTHEKWHLRLPAHLCSFREGQLPSQSSQAVEGVLDARQRKLMTVFLQIPITQPTNRRQVLGFPIPIVTIQIIHRQTMQPHVGTFRPPAILTPILSTYFGKLDHSLKEIHPSLVPGLEKTVYLLPGGQPLHTHFPSPEPTRPCIAFHLPRRPSTIPGRFFHRNQFGHFRFFSHCIIHHPTPHFLAVPVGRLAKPGGPLPIRKDVLILYHKFLFNENCNNLPIFQQRWYNYDTNCHDAVLQYV
jgi:hypothetical protein